MVSATPMTAAINAAAPAALTRQDLVPSRKRVTLPAWLEIAKPRLIPLLLATTLGGMALSEGWPLPLPRRGAAAGEAVLPDKNRRTIDTWTPAGPQLEQGWRANLGSR